jgi:hypothetical protein
LPPTAPSTGPASRCRRQPPCPSTCVTWRASS